MSRHSGFEAWRKLVADFELKLRQRKLALLRYFMDYAFSALSARESEAKVLDWEPATERYESASAKTVDDDLKVAVVLQGLPDALRTHLELNDSMLGQL